MDKEELLNSNFFKQFNSGEELSDFLGQIQKSGLEQLLEGELDSHLGYEKYKSSSIGNQRNGYGSKTIKTSLVKTKISVPRD